MFYKSSSPQFRAYGFVSIEPSRYPISLVEHKKKSTDIFFISDVPMLFEVKEGTAIIAFLTDNGTFNQFMINKRIVVNKNIPFAIISLSSSTILIESPQSSIGFTVKTIESQHQLEYHPIKPTINVSEIFFYYYSVKGQNYQFDGDYHNFWELTYVDTGDLLTEIEGSVFSLSSQSLIMYLPNQFHKQRIEEGKSCSYFTIFFNVNMNWEDREYFRKRVFNCSHEMYELISKFIKYSTLMETYNVAYSKNLMLAYLQELIILLLHDSRSVIPVAHINPTQVRFEDELLDEINNYILKNIYKSISVDDICKQFNVGRTTFQLLFKKRLGIPPMQYISKLKMRQAQHLLVEETMSVTETAARLGFSSIYYFSRKFKQTFGIPPSEFLQSIYHKSNCNSSILDKQT